MFLAFPEFTVLAISLDGGEVVLILALLFQAWRTQRDHRLLLGCRAPGRAARPEERFDLRAHPGVGVARQLFGVLELALRGAPRVPVGDQRREAGVLLRQLAQPLGVVGDLGRAEQALDLAGQRVLVIRMDANTYRAASFLDDRILGPDTRGAWLSGAAGWRNVTRVHPSGIISTSCFPTASLTIGCLTLSTTSAPASAASRARRTVAAVRISE